MSLRLTLTTVTAIALIAGPTAEAHLVTRPKKDTLKAIHTSQKENLAHSNYVCNNGARHHKRWACKATKWLGTELKQTRRAIAAKELVLALGPLNCISCWYEVATCESGQRWNYNGSSGFDGGLQFMPSTWSSAGGGRFAPYAYMATPMQQIIIASYLSLSNWPICQSRYY